MASPDNNHSEAAPPWGRVIGAAIGLILLLTALVAAFTWPTSEMEPRDLPIAVAAPSDVAGPMEQELTDAGFDVTVVADRGEAVSAIEDRDVYGAIVAAPDGGETLIASAGSPLVAQQLTQMAEQQAAQQQTEPSITDIVPTPEADPRGAVFGAGALPLILGGIMTGAIGSLALRRTRERVVLAFTVAAGAGLALAGVLQGWLDVLNGAYLANAGVIALGILAVALPIVGLRHLIGVAAVGVVALLILLVGNPLSGMTSAPELLPFGWLGQYFPPGAAGSALRGTAFFDGAAIGAPLLVLGIWAAVGLVLTVVPTREGAQPGGPNA